jgi:acyl-CoA-dependent ceramide synthase
MGHSTACDIMFGIFVVTWFITRHVLYPLVIWSVYAHTPSAMAPGCYAINGSFVPASSTAEFGAMGGKEIWGNIMRAYTNRDGPICWNPTIRFSFLFLLIALQIIILIWFFMIAKIVYQVVRGQNADDVRSDDEGEDSEIETEVDATVTTYPIDAVTTCKSWTPVEEEVGVEGLNLHRKSSPGVRNYKRSANRSSGSRASGISIAGHSDRKDLLGRIGCDKPT